MIGKKVGHYNVLRKIGEGGMGEVYLAEDTSLDRRVALKFLPHILRQDATAHLRFMREAKSAGSLDHPFICHIHEVGEAEEQHFIAMEYVQGQTLKERLAEGAVPVDESIRIASEIAEALEVAHGKGIVHRDLKPANIMLTAQGHVKVMDFGLAKRLSSGDGEDQDISTALTQEGSTLGTLTYMSPEQIRGEPADRRSDLFALGILLYEMLTGAHPFRMASAGATAGAILTGEPASLPESRGVDARLEEIVRKLLAKRREDRYQSIEDFLADLSQGRRLVLGDKPSFPIHSAWRLVAVLVGSIALLVAAFVGSRYLLKELAPEGPAAEIAWESTQVQPRIAVLPFANLSQKTEDEIFSDGLTDSVISRLLRAGAFSVISRTSVMHFKGKDLPIDEIGQQLKADYILEGTLLKIGEQCRISARLIDVRTDSNVWGEDYLLTWSDIFTVQDEISTKVVKSANIVLGSEEQKALSREPTRNMQAYNSYLKGRYHLDRYYLGNQEYRQDFGEAEQFFLEAVGLDPGYADAWSGLAVLYGHRAHFEGKGQWLERAEESIQKTLTLDPGHAEARDLRAALLWEKGDFDGAYEEASRVLADYPNDHLALTIRGLCYDSRGFYESAVYEHQKAVDANPIYVYGYGNLVVSCMWLSRWEEALEHLEEARSIEPDWPQIPAFMGDIYFYGEGDLALAEESWQQVEDVPSREIRLGLVAARRGDLEAVRNVVEKYRDTEAASSGAYLELSGIAGEKALTVDRLRNKNYRQIIEQTADVKNLSDSAWKPLRADPQFQDLLRAAYENWHTDLARYGPSLPVLPPAVPTPEEVLAED